MSSINRKRGINDIGTDEYNNGDGDGEGDELGDINNSTTNTTSSSEAVRSVQIRKGKWTLEEEAYANKMIEFFNRGLLRIPPGTTLRAYLSEKLHW
jgi:hypothetical protein